MRYEYIVTAKKKRTHFLAAQMTCFGDNAGDAIHHAKQWWATESGVEYESWCKITAKRTGRAEK